jgi:hypothetical protein
MNKQELTDRIYDTLMGNVGMSEHHVKFPEVEDPEVSDDIEFDYEGLRYRLTLEEVGVSPDQNDRNHLYKELYEMDGRGLADYLNDWASLPEPPAPFEWIDESLEIDSSNHGETVFIKGETMNTDLFKRWDLWRHEVSYYFDDFMVESRGWFDTIEDLKEYFVFRICSVLGIIADLEEYFEVNKPFEDTVILFT